MQSKGERERHERLQHADRVAAALHIDMTRRFTPTAENFFDRVSKARIAEALTEAGKAPDATKLAMKKAQFAKIAEFEMAGTGWLPKSVRIDPERDDNDQPETFAKKDRANHPKE